MRYGIFILIVVAVIVYINTLANGFIWDDEDLIMEDKYIKSPQYIGYLFTPQYWKKDFVAHEGRFRPLRALTFVAEWQIWKKNPVGYHLTNLLLNLAAVFGVYYLAQILFNGESVKSFFSALLFAVHPVHTESVAWIKNRTDILMTIFYVLAAGLFIRYFKMKNLSLRNYFVVSVLFVLALLSKEAAITLPLVLGAYIWIIGKETEGDSLSATGGLKMTVKKIIPLVVLSVVFLGFIIWGLRASQLKSPIDIKANFLVLAQYLRLLVLPYDLNAERALVTGIDLIGPVFFATVIYLVVRKKLYLEMFALLWILITLLPALDIRFITSRPIAEQRLYLPSVGLCLLAGSQMSPKLWSRILLILIIVSFSGITFARNFDWRDSVRFWEKTVRQSPTSARAWNNLGLSYERQGNISGAINSYRSSILLKPDSEYGYINLANLLFNVGQYSEAKQLYEKLLSITPRNSDARFGLAKVYLQLKMADKSAAIYSEILTENPMDINARNARGVIYLIKGKAELAEKDFEEVLRIDNENTDALYNLAQVYQREQKWERAVECYQHILEIDPEDLNAKNNLGIIYDITGRTDESQKIFQEIVRQSPGFYQAHYNLGNLYLRQKKYLEALAAFRRVLEIKPGHTQALKMVGELKKIIEKKI